MGKTTFKKVLGLLLAATLITAPLAGCQSAPSSSESAAPAASASGTDAGTPAATGGAITVEVFDRGNTGGSDPANNFWTTWIKEKIKKDLNLDVTFVVVPRSEEVNKLNVLMAANQAPDISYTYTESVAYNFFKNGGLADLSQPLADYGKDLTAYLGDEVLSYGQWAGKQAAVPAKRISRAKYATYLRKDWVDKMGMQMPKTREEFHQILLAIKEKNPGGVENVIPMTATSDVPWCFGPIIDSFINVNASEEELYVNNVIDEQLLLPGFKDGIRYINQLYNEGLVDPQFPLYKDSQQVDADTARGVVGSYTGNYDYPLRTSPGIITQLKANIPDAEFVPVDCFENADGKNYKTLYSPAGLLIIVPASSKNVNGAVQYLNWLSLPENRDFITMGEEGVHHTLDEENIPVMQSVTGDKIMNSPNNLDYALVLNGVEMGDPEKNVKLLSKSYDVGLDGIFLQAYDAGTKDGGSFPRTGIPIDAEAQFSNTLKEKKKEILANAIVAPAAQFDTVYDAGIQEYLQAGAQQCLDERQAAWDSVNK